MKKHDKTQVIDSIADLEDFIDKIKESNRNFLFRGTNRSYPIASSSLYRLAKKKRIRFDVNNTPFHLEEKYAKRAKKHFPEGTPNIVILSDFQHCYLVKTNLIDFTTNPYVAVYFACYGLNSKKRGEIIYFDRSDMEERADVVYEELKPLADPFVVMPENANVSRERVTSQDSVFVYPPSGYINKCKCKIIQVQAKLKQSVLAHLRDVHNIHENTVLVDLYPYKESDEIYKEVLEISTVEKKSAEDLIKQYSREVKSNPDFSGPYCKRGIVKNLSSKHLYLEERHLDAIADFDKAIEINPKFASAFLERANAKMDLANLEVSNKIKFDFAKDDPEEYQKKERIAYQGAIDDLKQAIAIAVEAKICCAKAYLNLGIIEVKLGQNDKAIVYYNEAIKSRDDYADAYYNRGNVKFTKQEYKASIEDYDEAIRLDSRLADYYRARGNAKSKLGRYMEAKVDYDMGIKLKPESEGITRLIQAVNMKGAR